MTNLSVLASLLSKQVVWMQLCEIQKTPKNPKGQYWISKSGNKASSKNATLRNMRSKLVHTLGLLDCEKLWISDVAGKFRISHEWT
jgi:hypothetical protein